jgi:hypothetical protein
LLSLFFIFGLEALVLALDPSVKGFLRQSVKAVRRCSNNGDHQNNTQTQPAFM